jgi:AraC-like DNA-binding protein
MVNDLDFLSDRLRYHRAMDVLSDAVSAMRIGTPHSSRTVRRAPWAVRFEPYNGAGFHAVLAGHCWLTPAGGEPIALRAGDVAFLGRGQPHALADSSETPLAGARAGSLTDPPPGAAGSGPSALLLCGGYLLDDVRPHPLLGELPDVVRIAAGHHPGLDAVLRLLGAELEDPRPGAQAIVPALADVLILYALRAWLAERAAHPEAAGWAAALRDGAVSAALAEIHRAPARPWTVADLATAAGLSRAAFARRFAALVGQPPLTYLTWWRMSTAARLLRASDATLGEVGAGVGYSSEFAFAKAFKREHGVAPGAYRRGADDPPAPAWGRRSPPTAARRSGRSGVLGQDARRSRDAPGAAAGRRAPGSTCLPSA